MRPGQNLNKFEPRAKFKTVKFKLGYSIEPRNDIHKMMKLKMKDIYLQKRQQISDELRLL